MLRRHGDWSRRRERRRRIAASKASVGQRVLSSLDADVGAHELSLSGREVRLRKDTRVKFRRLTESDVIEPACIGKLLLLRLIKQLLLGVSNF